ncbi:Dinitrogenase iron-molybdenum cofactor biosynthesis protein [Photobacterium marinum]|uniref:Dinitrogenase iron-molybdenum cofactor biosynthesis protein n=1 Tax=Photobacterium marinum TaxID=1056511 RepID=L8JF07_9GAMM|nr:MULTISPECIES: NifB/NifX family molybdenum-iron cluster-binding protein [Photobacterium]ELR66803.1 Dinitrogenase iron-molybdenum cofactor biosynthesis protein [Photobacterium marinum]
MKIALTTSSQTLDGELDKRFGRAPGFLIYDTERNICEFVDNKQNLNAAQGAGIQAAQNIIATGAECLITGNCGPKAFKVLQSAGVKIFSCDMDSLKACVEQFISGGLTEISDATVESHWS